MMYIFGKTSFKGWEGSGGRVVEISFGGIYIFGFICYETKVFRKSWFIRIYDRPEKCLNS